MNDPEPERYYDWILWKFRKEKEMENDQNSTLQANQERE